MFEQSVLDICSLMHPRMEAKHEGGDIEDQLCNATQDHVQSNDTSTRGESNHGVKALNTMRKESKKCGMSCFFVIWIAVTSAMLCCLVTCLTFVAIALSLLSNTILYVYDSMRGQARKRNLVSPVSDALASCILAAAIIILGVWVLTLHGIEMWKGRIISSETDTGLWIEIVLVILGYCVLGTTMRALVAKRERPLNQLLQGLLETAYFALLLPMVLMLMALVPTWKQHKILGLLAWKWVRATVLVVLCHTFIAMIVKAGVYFSKWLCQFAKGDQFNGSKRVYYYLKGLRKTVTFTLVALMHLMVWKLYFVRRISSKSLSDIGSWTIVCEVILGGLWLLKNFTLEYWLANSIYNRPDEQMMRKMKFWNCLHQLGLIKWRGKHNTQESVAGKRNDKSWSWYQCKSSLYDTLKKNAFVYTRQTIEDVSNHRRKEKWEAATKTLIDAVNSQSQDNQCEHIKDPAKIASIHDKKKIAYAFYGFNESLASEEKLNEASKDWNKYISNRASRETKSIEEKDIQEFVSNHLWKKPEETDKSSDTSSTQHQDPSEVAEKTKLSEKKASAAKILYEQLRETNKDTKKVYAEDFDQWKERACQNCLQLQYQLESASGVLNFLNKAMIGFIVTLVVILWLLFTEILSTKAIVVISSPFLAATFIFGDTLKSMFRGIVFAYIMHPFTVGDLCVIDGTQMEVKRIGVWRTTFSKLATEEEVLIPNSILESKAIINCERHPKLILQDVVEFSLDNANGSEAIEELQNSIKSIINGDRHHQRATQDIKRNGGTGNEIQEEKGNLQRTLSEPLRSLKKEEESKPLRQEDVPNNSRLDPSKKKTSLERRNSEPINNFGQENDVMMVVKQIQDSIEVAVHFTHKETINDMTKAQAYDAKCIQKSKNLRAIAKFMFEQFQSDGKDGVKPGPATKKT